MTDLRQLQQHFMGHLLGRPTGIVEQIASTPMMSAPQRLRIYSSAYRLRLKEALSTDYEKLHGYLGDEQFEQLMDDYIDSHTSSTYSLRYYSIDLPTWLSAQAQYNNYPQLMELASIEKAFADSFDAETIPAINLSVFAEVSATAWPDMTFTFQPSLQILQFNSNAFAIWKALADEQTPPQAIFMEQGENWVLWRKQDLVSHYRPLETAEQIALTKAVNGANFAEICESLLAFCSEEETPMKAIGFLQSWVQEEMISKISFPS